MPREQNEDNPINTIWETSPSIYRISGYFIDDNSKFIDYYVTNNHNTNLSSTNLSDDDIFFYGLSEETIKKAILSKTIINGEFIITSYQKEL